MNYSIEAEQVCKQFKDNLALDNVDLKVESGSICGLVGRNGSGKTVLMKCICGLMPLTSGKIIVNGKTIGRDVEIPKSVGVIIETPGFLNSFSAYSNLKFLADISGKADKQAIRAAIKSVGLDPDSKKHVGKYSLGMRQRLGLAQAIMEDPELLILDEPSTYIDKRFEARLYQLLAEINRDCAIILVSHDIGTVLQQVKNIACVNETLDYHPAASVNTEWLERNFNCPIELLGHGTLPHRVLGEHHHHH